MSIWEIIRRLVPFVKPYRRWVVISHSIAQIVDSDVIYVLKEGRVVEHGTHAELYQRHGTYSEIFDASARSLNLEMLSQTLGDGS